MSVFIMSNINLNKMDKSQQEGEKSFQWRLKLIKLLSIDIKTYLLPFFYLEIILNIIFYIHLLKFSIDYLPQAWFGSPQPALQYLDLSFYFNFASASTFFDYSILFLVFINVYWMLPIFLYFYQIERSNKVNHFFKVLYLIVQNILAIPIINVFLNLFTCQTGGVNYRKCFENYNAGYIFIYTLSIIFFFAFLFGQAFLEFQFIKRENTDTRLRRTGITNCVFLGYALINEFINFMLPETPQLVLLNLTTIILFVVIIVARDEVSQKILLMQISFVSVQLLSIFFVDICLIPTIPTLPQFLFGLLAPVLFIGVMQLKTTNLRFQLENINKWPTSEIMISYARKLRDYVALRDDYTYRVYIHGYMEIHRQKCDNPVCPSRCQLSDADRKLFENGSLKRNEEQVLRCENIIKKIYEDGYKVSPISPELQLQNSTFLYARGEKELSLRNLLAIKLDRLSLDKFYCYNYLKEKLHYELNTRSNKFLDLVSQMLAKKEEEQIFHKFEKAALINLEFWSLLNDDHPDFQKLNQVGLLRIRIKEEIRKNYADICSIAHSERVTAQYANYLESIENDELMFNQIYSNIKKMYGLDQKIILQDWANSSSNIMLVSVEDATYGKIVDVNTSCATTFGYQKFQLVNQSLRNIFLDELKNQIKEFLSEATNGMEFFITHKSGYLMQIKKHAQNYNSMETGMTVIVNIEVSLNPNCCTLVFDKQGKTIGVTPSIIPLMGIDLRSFESEVIVSQIFYSDLNTLKIKAMDKQTSYLLKDLVKKDFYQLQQKDVYPFKIGYSEHLKHIAIELRCIIKAKRMAINDVKSVVQHDFQFQVEANVGFFKYLGSSKHGSSTSSNFSKFYQKRQESQEQENIYQKGITTLRLRNNVIQIIQEVEAEDLNEQNARDAQTSNHELNLARKDEQEIFQSKETFQKFIKDYNIVKRALYVMGAGVLVVVGMQSIYYTVFMSHNNQIVKNSYEIARQSQINGIISKSQTVINRLALAANNRSDESASHILQVYREMFKYLQTVYLLGSQPFPLSLVIDGQEANMLSASFILTLINYASSFMSNVKNDTDSLIMWRKFTNMDPYLQSFLIDGPNQAKQQMVAYTMNRQSVMNDSLLNYISSQAVMISMGIIFILIFAIFIVLVINSINNQRINIFEIFLEISDAKIQQFSNRSEKLLISLHVEQANDQIDDEGDKKVSSSNFAKKKSFKQVSFNKSIYLKLMIIPLCFLGYFIHSYTVSVTTLNFQKAALPYFRLSAYGNFVIYSNLTDMQKAFLTSNSSAVDTLKMGTEIRQYYRSYFRAHYESFGLVADYHQSWIDLFFSDICVGQASPFGNTKVVQSCFVQNLATNGTFMIVGDLVRRIETFNFQDILSKIVLYEYEAISKSHRLITTFLIKAQEIQAYKFFQQMALIILGWQMGVIALILIWGIPVTRKFVMEINQIKNVIAILPISLARQLPKARKYFSKILKQQCC